MLLPYPVRMLEKGEKCFCMVHHHSVREMIDKLGILGINTDQLRPGQLDIREIKDTYLQGGTFVTDRTMALMRQQIQEADRMNFPFTRLCGDMSWAVQQGSTPSSFLEYEARLNLLMPEFTQSTVCFYNLEDFHGDLFMEVIKVHPIIYLNGLLMQNPYYVRPLKYLKHFR